MASSLLVCFVGFQMTLGLSFEIKCKLAVLFVAQMVQIYLICYFSDLLINASASVSNAVYEMNWIEADMRFKKMLIIVAARAQRPVNLRATVFLDVSMQTMTMFLQMTYRFFCMIRTMYQ
ncbi:odorant receptor 67a-like [Drosophila virilis]|uniref:odorant receptor 67a-like n=1 Tax=Drosophila virilis TaxID=7244 RepID=UPI0038B328F8